MKAMIIIGHDGKQMEAGHDAMLNNLGVCDCVMKDAKDGDRVTFQGEGVLVDHGDGKRFISVDKVDGEPVEDLEDGEMDQDIEETGGEDHSDEMMDSNDALDNFMQKRKQNANSEY